jgi:hypothetical protein
MRKIKNNSFSLVHNQFEEKDHPAAAPGVDQQQ